MVIHGKTLIFVLDLTPGFNGLGNDNFLYHTRLHQSKSGNTSARRIQNSSVANYSCNVSLSWWCHQMETFSALLAICAGDSPVNGEFPSQRPVTLSFDVFCDLRLNKQLSKQSWGWWFETPLRPLWRHCNVFIVITIYCKATILHLYSLI